MANFNNWMLFKAKDQGPGGVQTPGLIINAEEDEDGRDDTDPDEQALPG
jgi:hypothetical protein